MHVNPGYRCEVCGESVRARGEYPDEICPAFVRIDPRLGCLMPGAG